MSFLPSKDDHTSHRAGESGSRDARSAFAHDPVRIRKYPNRRLYDTSRSRHLTHDGVIALVAEGRMVQVTDSRSGADITNAVLLQILIERDPAKVAAIPSELVLRAMRADSSVVSQLAALALRSWPASAGGASGTPMAGGPGALSPNSRASADASPPSPSPSHSQSQSPSGSGGSGFQAVNHPPIGGARPSVEGSATGANLIGYASPIASAGFGSASLQDGPGRARAKAKRQDAN
jgi:polyhydroxyalkanoate synthesis repressor PhaR